MNDSVGDTAELHGRLVGAIRSGSVAGVRQLLGDHPGLVTARIHWVTDRVEELLTGRPDAAGDLNECFWQACHDGQLRTAQHLLARGADIDATPDYADEHPVGIAGSAGTARDALITWLREQGALGAGPVDGT